MKAGGVGQRRKWEGLDDYYCRATTVPPARATAQLAQLQRWAPAAAELVFILTSCVVIAGAPFWGFHGYSVLLGPRAHSFSSSRIPPI